MARSTVFRYKGRDVEPQAVGAELNVRAVMTGRLQKFRDRFSISAELVDVNDGAQLWGRTVFGETCLTCRLCKTRSPATSAKKLKLKLSSGEKRKAPRQRTKGAEAYELYLEQVD